MTDRNLGKLEAINSLVEVCFQFSPDIANNPLNNANIKKAQKSLSAKIYNLKLDMEKTSDVISILQSYRSQLTSFWNELGTYNNKKSNFMKSYHISPQIAYDAYEKLGNLGLSDKNSETIIGVVSWISQIDVDSVRKKYLNIPSTFQERVLPLDTFDKKYIDKYKHRAYRRIMF